ncbi:uncharacterized protein LOC131594466 [Vicia villosa]|uniref:uncharacterized protein LOC131594466 n=1 Tax=Vicia villosa TaxID=3911 RepID=UPI00273C55F8|nr:uncharacterized protein LOC131594466 [Vicia villosa]
MILSSLLPPQDMVQYFDQVVNMVLKSLDDPDSRVLCATMHAIKCLTEYKELLMNGRYHKKLLATLVPSIRSYSCARVQRTFRQNYYDSTMEALKVIVFNKHSLSRLLVLAKYLECMVYLVRKVGPDNFKEQEAIQASISANSILNWVMESIISLEGKLSNIEHTTKYIILKVLDQICRCPRVSIDKFTDKIIQMLLGSAQLCLDLTVAKLKDDHNKRLIENMMVLVCNTLSYCVVRSSINFSTYISKVVILFVQKIIKIGTMKEQGVGTLGGRCESLPTEDTLQVVSLNSLAFEYTCIE